MTYNEYKDRIDIQDVLMDAGYQLNRRDGLKYPSYVRIDSDGKRVHGDKFVVTANGMCCFQPPERKNYNVISFIKSFPEKFGDYRPGMSPDRLVNLVCRRLLGQGAVESATVNIGHDRSDDTRSNTFNLNEYKMHAFDIDDFDTQKAFYPFFKSRGIDLQTQRAFADHFFLGSKERTDGRNYTNLCFPLTLSRSRMDCVGLEERGKPNAQGKSYKGMARGSNASEGMWIARLESHQSTNGFEIPIEEVEHVFWFESAFDAMAYYQINRDKDIHLGDAVFVSTGGSPSHGQFKTMLETTPNACHHLCFDNDMAGRIYSVNFVLDTDKRICTTAYDSSTGNLKVTDHTDGSKTRSISMEPFKFSTACLELGIYPGNIVYSPADSRYKDWNDQLLDKPMSEEVGVEEETRPRYRR